MITTDLTPKIDQLKAAFATIEANRKLWESETRELLQKTLKQIKAQSGLDLQVQYLSGKNNAQGVNLLFNASHSGIYEVTQKESRAYVKHGGYIVFSQAYNGKIFVLISYPHVEELVSQAPVMVVGKYNPADITESSIYEAVGLFLDEMTKWETDGSINSEVEEEIRANPVGFAYGQRA